MYIENTEKLAAPSDNQYRYDRFTTSLLFSDLRFRKSGLGPGDSLPAFDLVSTDGDRLTKQDLTGDKPLLVIFGSVTCPMTASAMPSLRQLHDEFGDQVRFLMLNVREAHPGENFRQPKTMREKLDHTRALKRYYEIPWTVAADNIDGDLHRALDPKPNAAFLIGSDGVIVFRSLWASDKIALRQAVQSLVAGRSLARSESRAMLAPVARAMGRVQEVMDRAGPQAVVDLWRAGLPMALAGRIATIFTSLSPDRRGIAAVLTLAIGTLAVSGLAGAWLLN